jgi:molecular chaperone GrpE
MFGLGSMEKRISEKIEGFEGKIERFEGKIAAFEEKIETYLSDHIDGRFDSLNGRLDDVDERLQQSVRQERRNQAAMESIFENQKTELAMLRGMRGESNALKALMVFAESFVLWCQSQPDSPEFQVLWAKLASLLDLFGLEILAEAGVPFDPSKHEACAVRYDPYEPEGCVLETIRPGFVSGGEILRYASVVVNRLPVTTENETEDAADTFEGEPSAE